MQFEVFTLLPEVFPSYLESSILQRARERGLIDVRLHNIRDWARDKHHTTDDTPYGGGGGMVMKPEPISRAVETVLSREPGWRFEPAPGEPSDRPPAVTEPVLPLDVPIILLSPQGRTFTQKVAEELAGHRRLALICGRYEGVDERVRANLVTDEISIGDFVISGGELAAAIVVDAVTRLQPGALGCEMGAFEDSFATGLLEYPQYTRPAAFRGEGIPEILASGDHAKVARWRREQALLRTWQRRPDLLNSAPLSAYDRAFLARLEAEAAAQKSQESGGGDPVDMTPA